MSVRGGVGSVMTDHALCDGHRVSRAVTGVLLLGPTVGKRELVPARQRGPTFYMESNVFCLVSVALVIQCLPVDKDETRACMSKSGSHKLFTG